MPKRRQRLQFVVLAVAFESGLGILAWLIGWLAGVPIFNQFYWNSFDALVGIVAAIPLFGIFLFLVHARTHSLNGLRRSIREIIQPMFRGCGLIELAFVSAAAGVGEETLFRGVLQAAIGRWLGPIAGLVVTSVCFGLLHPLSKMYVLIAFGFGLYLGAWWLASGNLLVVIAAHALYDFLALAYLVRTPPSDGNLPDTSGS